MCQPDKHETKCLVGLPALLGGNIDHFPMSTHGAISSLGFERPDTSRSSLAYFSRSALSVSGAFQVRAIRVPPCE
jgi:hypothetical protein